MKLRTIAAPIAVAAIAGAAVLAAQPANGVTSHSELRVYKIENHGCNSLRLRVYTDDPAARSVQGLIERRTRDKQNPGWKVFYTAFSEPISAGTAIKTDAISTCGPGYPRREVLEVDLLDASGHVLSSQHLSVGLNHN